MHTNTGVPYELLTQEIFQQILNQKSVHNIDVKQNVVLVGKSANHQIDIYWEFEQAGIRYRTVVQAKDWSTPVNQGELIKFKGVLDDLPSQPRGIFVTRSRYQAGAAKFAREHGILLYVLRQEPDPPPPEPLKVTNVGYARIRIAGVTPGMHFILETTVFTPTFSDLSFVCDHDWLEGIKQGLGGDVAHEIVTKRFNHLPHEVLLYDQTGKQVGNLRELYVKLARDAGEQGCARKEVKHAFVEPTFIEIPGSSVSRVKVISLCVTMEVQKCVDSIIVPTNFVIFVLKSLDDGSVKRFRGLREPLPAPEQTRSNLEASRPT
jgi:hypothetical protein